MIARSHVTDPRAAYPVRNAHLRVPELHSHGPVSSRDTASTDFFPFHPQLNLLRITVLII
jgi:hypothetical protein